MIHYFYGTLQVSIGQTLCSFEHVSCFQNTVHYLLNYDVIKALTGRITVFQANKLKWHQKIAFVFFHIISSFPLKCSQQCQLLTEPMNITRCLSWGWGDCEAQQATIWG